MLQLVYTSVATRSFSHAELLRLCAQSTRNNKMVEITGVLIRHGNRFMQALEGPKAVVEDTFLRVVVDPRHRGVTLLSRRIITYREFGNWSMGLFDDPAADGGMQEAASDLTASAPAFIQRAFAALVGDKMLSEREARFVDQLDLDRTRTFVDKTGANIQE